MLEHCRTKIKSFLGIPGKLKGETGNEDERFIISYEEIILTKFSTQRVENLFVFNLQIICKETNIYRIIKKFNENFHLNFQENQGCKAIQISIQEGGFLIKFQTADLLDCCIN